MKKNKYSDGFLRDFKWYLSVRHIFTFDGSIPNEIKYNKDGVDGMKAFHVYDSQGKLLPTKHPNILSSLLKTKGSVNFHIKQYAEDRAKGYLPLIEFRGMCFKFKSPDWFFFAVENQKYKFYSAEFNEIFKLEIQSQKERRRNKLKY